MIRSLLVALSVTVAVPALAQTAPSPAPQDQAAPAGQTPAPLEVSVTGGVSAPMPIAIRAMPTAQVVDTPAGSTDVLGRQMAEIIANDLRNSGLFTPLGANRLRPVGFQEVNAPAFDYWRGINAPTWSMRG